MRRRRPGLDAAAYDAEVARIEADRSWETATHRAGRLILAGVGLPSGVEGVRVAMIGTGEVAGDARRARCRLARAVAQHQSGP